mgnify:CR=1 FL=1
MGILDKYKAPALTNEQKADIQKLVSGGPYVGGSRVRPDWSGKPLPPLDPAPARAEDSTPYDADKDSCY